MSQQVVLGISGSTSRPSRTALVREIVARFSGNPQRRVFELADEAPHLFGALNRAALRGRAAEIVEAVESADVLVVATPVYRASYTGALKHLFNLVDHRALRGRPGILAATGGLATHGLMTEHQMRPLLGFFGAASVPTAIFAIESNFHADAQTYVLRDGPLGERIDRAVSEAQDQAELCDRAARRADRRQRLSRRLAHSDQ